MRLSELCTALDARGFPVTLDGEDRVVRAVNTISEATEGEVTFFSNPKYRAALAQTRASGVFVRDGIQVPSQVTALRAADPYAAVTVAITVIHGHRSHPQWGISEGATIDASAEIGAGVNIAHDVTIGARARIGAGCTLYPGCYVGAETVLGDETVLYPNVVIYEGCELGKRCRIHAGSVIGQDGLGYAPVDKKWLKIPQVGRVVLGDDVEIGANCAIDRATLGVTSIGRGTKFGNVNVVGHGTRIGEDSLLVGLVGLAGSTTVGNNVLLTGMVGVAGHVTIGDGAVVAAKSGVQADVPAGETYFGYPAEPMAEAKRSLAAGRRLPELARRLRALEREIEALKASGKPPGPGTAKDA